MATKRSSTGPTQRATRRPAARAAKRTTKQTRPTKRATRRAAKRPGTRRSTQPKRWSARVMETSNALDLERNVFTRPDPKSIARSLKRSAERSRRRKADPFRSAMSMLVFYINRAGRNLPKQRRDVLERAKDELRTAFHRPQRGAAAAGRAR